MMVSKFNLSINDLKSINIAQNSYNYYLVIHSMSGDVHVTSAVNVL